MCSGAMGAAFRNFFATNLALHSFFEEPPGRYLPLTYWILQRRFLSRHGQSHGKHETKFCDLFSCIGCCAAQHKRGDP